MLDQITPLILTYNEAPNIGRTLQKLTWAKRIVVIDSYSTDQTLEILRKCWNVEVFQREFDSFARQCNYGLSKIDSNWVLSLDADYVLSDGLVEELRGLDSDFSIDGYAVSFKYCVFGKPLRGALLPPRKVLYRREKSSYVDDGHAHRISIQGRTSVLRSPIYHDDRKSLSRWIQAQDQYMILETKKLHSTPGEQLGVGDKLRKKKVLAPFIILFYCLILKRGIFDGWRGWYYAFQRVFAEILLSIRLIETQTEIL